MTMNIIKRLKRAALVHEPSSTVPLQEKGCLKFLFPRVARATASRGMRSLNSSGVRINNRLILVVSPTKGYVHGNIIPD
jgi:hypothetical protein